MSAPEPKHLGSEVLNDATLLPTVHGYWPPADPTCRASLVTLEYGLAVNYLTGAAKRHLSLHVVSPQSGGWSFTLDGLRDRDVAAFGSGGLTITGMRPLLEWALCTATALGWTQGEVSA